MGIAIRRTNGLGRSGSVRGKIQRRYYVGIAYVSRRCGFRAGGGEPEMLNEGNIGRIRLISL